MKVSYLVALGAVCAVLNSVESLKADPTCPTGGTFDRKLNMCSFSKVATGTTTCTAPYYPSKYIDAGKCFACPAGTIWHGTGTWACVPNTHH